MSFIFGGNTNLTYEQAQEMRKRAEAMAAQTQRPQTFGQGLSALGEGLASGIMRKKSGEVIEDTEAKAGSVFRDILLRSLGDGQPRGASFNPAATQARSPSQSVADDAMRAIGRPPVGGMEPYRDAIARIESDGSGGYSAVGPTHPKLGRALGRYQVMEANIGPWTREALGQEFSPEEFLQSPQIQDAVFDHKFGGYVDRFGPEGAAQAWFAGPGGVGKMGRKDSLGTSVADYTQKFSQGMGGRKPTRVAGGGAGVQEIMQAMAAPGMSADQKSVLGMLLQQRMQANDPMQQMQMERAQLELEQMRNPQPDFAMLSPQEVQQLGLPEGAYQRGRDGKVIKVGGGGVTVNNNMGGDDPGRYIYAEDAGLPKGWRFDTETQQAERIPGGPADVEKQQAAEQEMGREAQTRRAGSTVIQDLQRGLDLIPELSVLSQNEGVIGGIARTQSAKVPGTVANRITQFTESALSNVGLDTLQQMRENSPTGGALGQVPIQQQKRLEMVLGSLQINQPPPVLEANMKRVMNIYTDIIHGSPEERAQAVNEGLMTPEQNEQIEGFYYELPFDERGRAIDQQQDTRTNNAPGRPQQGAQGEQMDFSNMSRSEIGQVDINSLSLEQMDALEARMQELGL